MTTQNHRYNITEIPESIEVLCTIYLKISGYDTGKIGVYCFDWDGDKDSIVLCKPKITFPIAVPTDIRATAISSLREAIKSVQAEAFKQIQEIQERIDGLLQIEYKTDDNVIVLKP